MKRHNPYAPPGRKDEPRLKLSTLLRWVTPGNVLLLAIFLIEGLWLYLWLLLIGNGTGLDWNETPLTIPSILLVLFTSYYSVQVLGQQSWSTRKAQSVAAALIIVTLLLVFRLENGGGYGFLDVGWLGFANQGLVGSWFTSMQLTLLGSVYLWWRGYHLAREGLSQATVFHSFIVGLIAIILGLLSWEALYRGGSLSDVPRGLAMFVVAAYFFASLLALSLSHLIRIRAEMVRRNEVSGFFNEHWALQLLGFVTAMMVIGLIVATVFSFSVVAPFLWILSGISKGFSLALFYILYPVALLVTGIIYILRWLIAQFGSSETPSITMPDFDNLRRLAVEGGGSEGTAVWLVLLKWGLLLAIVALGLYLLSRMLLGRRERPIPRDALEEVHESVGGSREFIRDLLLGLLRLLLWFQRRKDRVMRRIPVLRHMGERGMPDEELEVRELYGMLLLQSRDAGFPRHEDQTPLEYLETLEEQLPTEREAVRRITQDYVTVRYGERGVSPEEKGLVNRLWRGVYQRIREIVRPGE